MAVIATVLSIAQIQYISTRDRIIAETRASEIEIALKSVLSQAVEVSNDTAAGAGNLAALPGRLAANFAYNTIAASPVWTTIGVFAREVRAGVGNADPVSATAIMQTAVFYRRPAAATSGVLFIDLGNAAGAAMVAGYNDLYFDRISSISMTKSRHPTYDRVTSVNFTYTIRYHVGGAQNKNWCPAADMGIAAGCIANSGWRDLTRSFSVLLRNNLLGTSAQSGNAASAVSRQDRVMGNLHFFQPLIPKNF